MQLGRKLGRNLATARRATTRSCVAISFTKRCTYTCEPLPMIRGNIFCACLPYILFYQRRNSWQSVVGQACFAQAAEGAAADSSNRRARVLIVSRFSVSVLEIGATNEHSAKYLGRAQIPFHFGQPIRGHGMPGQIPRNSALWRVSFCTFHTSTRAAHL
jgi:hypothetical protein